MINNRAEQLQQKRALQAERRAVSLAERKLQRPGDEYLRNEAKSIYEALNEYAPKPTPQPTGLLSDPTVRAEIALQLAKAKKRSMAKTQKGKTQQANDQILSKPIPQQSIPLQSQPLQSQPPNIQTKNTYTSMPVEKKNEIMKLYTTASAKRKDEKIREVAQKSGLSAYMVRKIVDYS